MEMKRTYLADALTHHISTDFVEELDVICLHAASAQKADDQDSPSVKALHLAFGIF